MKIASDRRCREATPDPAAERMVRDAAAALKDAEIRVARGLARIRRKRTFLLTGCASAVEYGTRVGLSRRRALVLLRVGRALEADRDGNGERRLREGRMTTEDAAEVGKLHVAADRAARELGQDGTTGDSDVTDANPLIRPDDDWLARAGEISTTALRKEVNERIEGRHARERVRTLSIAARESVIEQFRRSQVIASRRAREILSDGATLDALTDDYLSRHDPLRSSPDSS